MAKKRDLASVLAELAIHHTAAAALTEEALDLVAAEGTPPNCAVDDASSHTVHNGDLVVCSSMCSVQWRGQCCVLGPSLLLRLIFRLAQHPNRFYTYDMLMEEVWQRRCTDAALRALVRRLRKALVSSGMSDLAAAIRVQGRCVGLLLDGNPD